MGEMDVTTKDIQEAFQRSGLNNLGYSFNQAIEIKALQICLVRLAKQKLKLAKPKATRIYWYQNI
jgi:hypothetical protein